MNTLTPKQVSIIKSFPREIIQYIKNALHSVPERKNDFKWIYESCIAECKVRNLSIDSILNKNGFNNCARKSFSNKEHTDSNIGYLSRKLYVPHVDSFTSDEAQVKVKEIMDNKEAFNKMVELIGEHAALIFQKKMIDNIINHIQEG